MTEPVGKPTGAHTAYRPDVDGLRAIAVLAVMLFHARQTTLPGGFLGVDIFFVISGFLITRNILLDINGDRFSIAEFYRRRIKRIAPAMLVVVALTLIASQLLELPEDARNTAKSGLFSLLSLANVYFWRYQDTSYFAPNSSQVPLLHLWSLGVEEQFYLLWPTILWLSYRHKPSKWKLALALVLVAVASFALGDLVFDRDPQFAYYMLPTRAGELLLGAVVAIAALGRPERWLSGKRSEVLATLAAVVLGSSLVLITEHQRFPGWRAAIPTGAVAVLILTGHCRRTLWARIFSTRWLVEIGLISYSAYLWHWPLLAFFRYGYGEPGAPAVVSFLLLTLALAWLSYRYVEQPARRSRASFRWVLVQQYVLPAGALVLACLVLVFPQRLGIRLHSRAYVQQLAALRDQTRPAYELSWVCQRERLRPEDARDPGCTLGGDSSSAPRAILWGDSHAAHYIGVVEAIAARSGFRFRNLEVGACPPLLSDPAAFVESRRAADCRASVPVAQDALDHHPVVIVSSAWLSYGDGYRAAFYATARSLLARGKLLIVLGEVPWAPGYDRQCREKALSFPWLRCPHVAAPPPAEVLRVNAELRRFAERTPGVRYFDVTPYLCPNGLCSQFSSTGTARYYDEKHLSLAGSQQLGREIVATAGVPKAFRAIGRSQPGAQGETH